MRPTCQTRTGANYVFLGHVSVLPTGPGVRVQYAFVGPKIVRLLVLPTGPGVRARSWAGYVFPTVMFPGYVQNGPTNVYRENPHVVGPTTGEIGGKNTQEPPGWTVSGCFLSVSVGWELLPFFLSTVTPPFLCCPQLPGYSGRFFWQLDGNYCRLQSVVTARSPGPVRPPDSKV